MGQHFNTLVEAARQKFWEASDDPFLDEHNRYECYGAYDAAVEALEALGSTAGAIRLQLIDEMMRDEIIRLGQGPESIDPRGSFSQAVYTLVVYAVAEELERDPEVVAKTRYRLDRVDFETAHAASTNP